MRKKKDAVMQATEREEARRRERECCNNDAGEWWVNRRDPDPGLALALRLCKRMAVGDWLTAQAIDVGGQPPASGGLTEVARGVGASHSART